MLQRGVKLQVLKRCLEAVGKFRVLVLTGVVSLSVIPLSATPIHEKPYTRPQHLVKISAGRRINLYCVGRGNPTVMLEDSVALTRNQLFKTQGVMV